VDLKNAVMGVAMAGTLVPRLSPLRASAWAVLFAAGTAWFSWQVMRDRRRDRAARGGSGPAGRLPMAGHHHGTHVLSCAAMVCMLLAAPGTGVAAGVRTAIAGTGAMPVVALVLAVAVVGSVVVSTDRIPSPAAAGAQAAARPVLCPRVAASCQIVMGVTMAYMLILML
jgi:hypothetical protein